MSSSIKAGDGGEVVAVDNDGATSKGFRDGGHLGWM